jgi:erythronate-4-phosphate dehydrogenase
VAGYSLEAKLAASRMMPEALSRFFWHAPRWRVAPLLEPHLLTGPLEGFTRAARVFARVVDLAGDDARVRELVELPVVSRAAAFERLRRDYRLRRDFRSWRVLGAREPKLAAWLHAAGFAS